MKNKPRSFCVKLWLYFAAFSAIIFAMLWLLQTVFFQNFYDMMLKRNTEKVAGEIIGKCDSSELVEIVDELTYKNSLLIFLTDLQGNVIYSSDEYSSSYRRNYEEDYRNRSEKNPYRSSDEIQSWQIGNYRNLPDDFDNFTEKLAESKTGIVSYEFENSYIYGEYIPASDNSSNIFGGCKAILYISSPIEAVGSAVSIIKMQLIWVTAASLIIGFILAFFIARKFSKPVLAISKQAKRMVDGSFGENAEKGFCAELDELSDTLCHTSAELKKAKEFQKELLANISHDLRTPLTMIIGYAEIIRDISWEEEKQRNDDLAVIIREANRLTELVNEILEYSELQSGSLEINFDRIDIGTLAESTIGQFESLCRSNGYTIEKEIQANAAIKGNEKLLTRVLYNLIDNAIRHTGESKKIKLIVKELPQTVRIEVCDHGEGISEDILPYIWDRYFTSRQRKQNGGSGLGLAIVKQIVLLHGGKYGADSCIGSGSVFWVELKKYDP
ncbi:MAG: ATP-binding protein [Oscillospiraceae bacterium]